MYDIKIAHSAGQTAAANEAAAVGSSGRVGGDQKFPDSADFASGKGADANGKAYATLRAEMAIEGFEVEVISAGVGGQAYLVKRWNLSKELPDLAAVRAFAGRAGVKP